MLAFLPILDGRITNRASKEASRARTAEGYSRPNRPLSRIRTAITMSDSAAQKRNVDEVSAPEVADDAKK